jgi:phosphate transport system substrate-binding protein
VIFKNAKCFFSTGQPAFGFLCQHLFSPYLSDEEFKESHYAKKNRWMTMNNPIHRTAFKVTRSLLFLFPVVFLLNCTQHQADETARSGNMTIAVDRQFEEITGTQAEMFSRYYPEASIKVISVDPAKSLKYLFDGKVKAALISGEPEPREDSLFAQMKRPVRREPVARDAIVCIVNSRNSALMFSIKDLGSLFSEQEKRGVTPLVTGNDVRLLSVFAAKIGKKRADLIPWACSSDTELINRVSIDKQAVGLIFYSALNTALKQGKNGNNIRIQPLAKDGTGASAYLPTQQNIFEGLYPLVTLVYYVYYPGEVLASGFGSWLGSSGQKAFERSSLAPYRLVERTIILK